MELYLGKWGRRVSIPSLPWIQSLLKESRPNGGWGGIMPVRWAVRGAEAVHSEPAHLRNRNAECTGECWWSSRAWLGCHGLDLQACHTASLGRKARRPIHWGEPPAASRILGNTITAQNLDVLCIYCRKHDPVIECDNCCHLQCARFSTNLSSLKMLLNVCHLHLITILGSRNY